jgi:putative ABC transport system substrate-binding protein
MQRREFFSLIGGAAVLPFAAHAQEKMPIIAIFNAGKASTQVKNLAALRDGLKQAGFLEGRNLAIEQHWAENQYDRLPQMAEQVVAQKPAVIVSNSLAAVRATAITRTIPIVFTTGSDPVRDGLVESLSRPGANVTGVVFVTGTLGAKRLELLGQFVPNIRTIAMLVYPGAAETEAERSDVLAAAHAVGVKVEFFEAKQLGDFDTAFAGMAARGTSALLVGAGGFLFNGRDRIVALATREKMPAMYSNREFAEAGGLISYGTSFPEAFHQAGQYVARILKGEKPSELPVIQSSKFELVINLKTAKTHGLEFHPQLLATADEVIE